MAVGTLLGLWRYPVKSMGGEALTSARVGITGIDGDRARGVICVDSGKVLSAKTVPRLLDASARWEDGSIRISGAGGLEIGVDRPTDGAALSEWLGRPVRIECPPAGARTTFDYEVEGPDGVSTLVELQTAPGLFFDGRSTLHLVSRAGLDADDVRRFRPNLLVGPDAEGAGAPPEDGWVGGTVTIGDVIAHVRKRTARCTVVTRAQPGLPEAPGLLRRLNSERGGDVGVYLDPIEFGTVTVGDSVVVAPPPPSPASVPSIVG